MDIGTENSYAETSIPKITVTMAKSARSRLVICASGAVFAPTIARKSEVSEGEALEPENVGGVGGAEPMRNTAGTTAVDMIPITRI
jgi:hypothetical protein